MQNSDNASTLIFLLLYKYTFLGQGYINSFNPKVSNLLFDKKTSSSSSLRFAPQTYTQ